MKRLTALTLVLLVGCSRFSEPSVGVSEERDQAAQNKEGGTGTRAKGEDGAMNKRYGVAGPKDNSPGTKAPRSDAPMEVARPPSSEQKSASGRMRGGAIGDSYGGGGLGLSGVGSGGGGVAKPSASAAPKQLALRATAEPEKEFNTESYKHTPENPFLKVADEALSTFSIDVDTASYANVRRFLTDGQRPPVDSVRIEEMINYFRYDYAEPSGAEPFSVTTEVAACPWEPSHRLVQVGLKGKSISQENVKPRNLVFLLDVSGSMESPDKLPLLKEGMALLARQMRPQDKLAIVVYAGASGLVLPATAGSRQGEILNALGSLQAGGSTNGGDGIQLAYRVAQENYVPGGVNRVILATDGDFNVGVTNEGDLTRLIEEKRKTGVFLTVLGFGDGNLKDSTMESLADKGNGNYAYIDSIDEARKVLVREAGSTLVTIAKDVKIQVEFNPKHVQSYRLIGYENRVLANEDFNDDKKDAGEIGAGHTVTALYEVVPVGAKAATSAPAVDPLKYQGDRALAPAAGNGELLTVKLRYKQPNSDTSQKLERVVTDSAVAVDQASRNLRFSAAVAEFGMVLRSSEHGGNASLATARKLAASAIGEDVDGDRRAFLALVDKASGLKIGR
jgi:Ca-activated chloride channel homolog